MSSLRIVVGTIWVAILLVTHGIWTATAVPIGHADILIDEGTTSLSEGELHGRDEIDAVGPPLLDMYGNEVEPAVGDYRIDTRGEVYERHHPRIALPEPIRPTT